MANEVVIVSAARTPVGSFLGAFGTVPACELGVAAMREALARAKVNPADVSEVILGQVFTAGQGQNPARQTSMKAGVPQEVPAYGVNMLCGSGLKAVVLGYQAIMAGDSKIVIAGGQESMSTAPHVINMRQAVKFGDKNMVDTMMKDGLICAFNNYHMGITAENLANEYLVTRKDQDEFAARSQQKAEAAQAAGNFKEEIVGVSVTDAKRNSQVVEQDEYIRKGASYDAMAKLRPAFAKEGTVTAGNASGLNDGAAAVVLMSRAEAEARGLQPLARIVSWGQAGVDPAVMGTGPIPATQLALKRAGWAVEDVDLFELNEAFAAQSLAVVKTLGVDPAKVNVSGGAIALGHPLGASGARVLVTLLYGLRRTGKRKGVAALCVGGGMGVALCVEAL